MANTNVRRIAIAVAALLPAVAPHTLLAVACPSGGASIEVCVTNASATASGPITVSGQAVGSEITCTGPAPIAGAYSDTIANVPPGQTVCAPAPAPNGLISGMYVHRIQTAATQNQYQQRPVLAAAPGQPLTRVDWAYAAHVITVNVAGDAGSGTCPVNAVSSPPTCDIRSALARAKTVAGTQPVLIALAVSPGTISGLNLEVERRRTTIDGTDANGNPWIVGDANAAAAGAIDPVPRVLEFSVNRGLRIMADEVTLRGLEIRHLQGSGTVSNANLVYQTANHTGTHLEAVRLNGDNLINCSDPAVDCSTFVHSLVRVEAQASAPTARSMTLLNVDARAGAYFGLEMLRNTDVAVEKSWLRHSYHGNIRSDAAALTLTRTTVERAGLRASDGFPSVAGAPGIRLSNSVPFGSPSTYVGLENVIRNNRATGLTASGLTDVKPQRDAFCGNGGSGITSAVGPSSFVPSITGQGGIGATYNTLHGARVAQDFATPVAFNNDSVFARNGQCGLFNEWSADPVSARNNQWVNPVTDGCTGQPGAAPVDTSFPQNADADAIVLGGTFPSNVILGGQTVQIAGSGFNAIRGNPAAGGGCVNGPGGASQSCCRATNRANQCAAVNTPVDGGGNCVEFLTGTGFWFAAPVRAVTPAMLEVEVPTAVFGCLGRANEVVRVAKKLGAIERFQSTAYCDNRAAM